MGLIDNTAKAITAVNPEWYSSAQLHLDNLTKPLGSLGRLEEFARRLVAIAERKRPVSTRR